MEQITNESLLNFWKQEEEAIQRLNSGELDKKVQEMIDDLKKATSTFKEPAESIIDKLKSVEPPKTDS